MNLLKAALAMLLQPSLVNLFHNGGNAKTLGTTISNAEIHRRENQHKARRQRTRKTKR